MLYKTITLFIAVVISCLSQTAGAASGSAEWDRGCNDAKSGSYDRSGKAGQAYEEGWNACHNGGAQSAQAESSSGEWDRGCNDAKSGSYDRSGKAGQAYEEGWNACHNGGEQSAQAESSKPSKKAYKTCAAKFGGKSKVKSFSALKPGWWEIILAGKKGRQVACTVNDDGTIEDWVEM